MNNNDIIENKDLTEFMLAMIDNHNPEWTGDVEVHDSVNLSAIPTYQTAVVVRPPFPSKDWTLPITLSWIFDGAEVLELNAADEPFSWELDITLTLLPTKPQNVPVENGMDFYGRLIEALNNHEPLMWMSPDQFDAKLLGQEHYIPPVFYSAKIVPIIEAEPKAAPLFVGINFEATARIHFDDDWTPTDQTIGQTVVMFQALERFVVNVADVLDGLTPLPR